MPSIRYTSYITCYLFTHISHIYTNIGEHRNINFCLVEKSVWQQFSKPARYYIVSIDEIFICQRRCVQTVYLIIRYFGHFFHRTTNSSILRLSSAPCLFLNVISHSFLRDFIWFRQECLEYVYNTKIWNEFLKVVICADKKQSDEQFLSEKYQKVLLYGSCS